MMFLHAFCIITFFQKENDSGSLKRHKRGLSPNLNIQNKLNNDNLKLRLDLNKILPQRPNILKQPITNIKVRPKPVGLASRLNALLRGPIKSNPVPPSTPPKINEKTISETINMTKCATESKNSSFYLESDDDDEETHNTSSISTPKLQPDEHIKETVLTKLKEECVDGKKDKNDAIIKLMNQLPSIIKTVMTKTIQSEANPIIIKNITQITLPIQRGSEIKTESQPCDKPNEVYNTTDKSTGRYSKGVENLLLKPILDAKQNNAEAPYSSIQVQANHDEIGMFVYFYTTFYTTFNIYIDVKGTIQDAYYKIINNI